MGRGRGSPARRGFACTARRQDPPGRSPTLSRQSRRPRGCRRRTRYCRRTPSAQRRLPPQPGLPRAAGRGYRRYPRADRSSVTSPEASLWGVSSNGRGRGLAHRRGFSLGGQPGRVDLGGMVRPTSRLPPGSSGHCHGTAPCLVTGSGADSTAAGHRPTLSAWWWSSISCGCPPSPTHGRRGAAYPRDARPRRWLVAADTAVLAIAARVWPGAAVTLEGLSGGITNLNSKATTPSGAFVIRLFGRDSELLAIDRETEQAATSMAAQLGIGPEVVACAPREGYLVTRFLPGQHFTAEQMRAPGVMAQVAATLRVLPQCTPHPGTLDPLAVVDFYRHNAQTRGDDPGDDYAWAALIAG